METVQAYASSRSRIITTMIYYAGFVALGLTAASLGPTLTRLADHTGSDIQQISVLFTARSFGYLLGSLLAGRVYDRLPGHQLMTAGLAALALTLALAPIIPWLAVLVAVFLFMGLAEGLFDVGGNTLLVWVHGARVGPFMNALHFFFGFGAFIAPVIVAQAVRVSGDINLAYWTLAVLTILPGVGLLFRSNPTHPHHSGETKAEPRSNRLLAMLMVFFFLYVGAEVSFGGWIFTYVQAQGLAGEEQAAYLTAAFWGAFTLGRLFSIPIARVFRPRTVLLVDLVGCILSVGAILAFPGSTLAGWGGAVGVGLFMASIFPTTILLAERRMTLTGSTTSLFFLGSSLGAMLIPFLIGQLFGRIGPAVTMGFILGALVLDLVVYWVLIQRFAPQKSEGVPHA
jgi:FHS family Na+ dependent glucose MFS transporter 1